MAGTVLFSALASPPGMFKSMFTILSTGNNVATFIPPPNRPPVGRANRVVREMDVFEVKTEESVAVVETGPAVVGLPVVLTFELDSIVLASSTEVLLPLVRFTKSSISLDFKSARFAISSSKLINEFSVVVKVIVEEVVGVDVEVESFDPVTRGTVDDVDSFCCVVPNPSGVFSCMFTFGVVVFFVDVAFSDETGLTEDTTSTLPISFVVSTNGVELLSLVVFVAMKGVVTTTLCVAISKTVAFTAAVTNGCSVDRRIVELFSEKNESTSVCGDKLSLVVTCSSVALGCGVDKLCFSLFIGKSMIFPVLDGGLTVVLISFKLIGGELVLVFVLDSFKLAAVE